MRQKSGEPGEQWPFLSFQTCTPTLSLILHLLACVLEPTTLRQPSSDTGQRYCGNGIILPAPPHLHPQRACSCNLWSLTHPVSCFCSVLLMVRVSIAAVSGSLSIIVTTLDAVLDVISGFIIWSTSLARQRRNKYRFPIGQVSLALMEQPRQRIFLMDPINDC